MQALALAGPARLPPAQQALGLAAPPSEPLPSPPSAPLGSPLAQPLGRYPEALGLAPAQTPSELHLAAALKVCTALLQVVEMRGVDMHLVGHGSQL